MTVSSPYSSPFRRNQLSVGLPIAVQVVALVLLTWLVDPQQFGDYALAFALISLLTILTTSWIAASQLNLARATEPDRQAEFFTTSILISLAGSLLVTNVALLILGLTNRGSAGGFVATLRYGLLSLPFLTLFCSGYGALSAMGFEMSRPRLKTVAPAFGMILGLLLVPLSGWGSGAMLIGSGVAAAIGTILLHREVAGSHFYRPRQFSWPLAGHFVTAGLPMVVPALCWLLIGCCDRFVVAFLYGRTASGTYSLGWSLADRLMLLVPTILLVDFAPGLIRQYKEDRLEARRVLSNEIARYVLLALPVVITVLALGRDVFRLLVPPSYGLGAISFVWIAVSGFGLGFARYARKPLLLAGQTRRYTAMLVSAVVVNVILNLFLVPMLGLVGAGMAAVLTLAMLSSSLVKAGRKFIRWRLAASSLVVPAFSAALMAVTQVGLSRALPANCWALMLNIGAGFTVYFVVSALGLRLFGAGLRFPLTRFYRSRSAAFVED